MSQTHQIGKYSYKWW